MDRDLARRGVALAMRRDRAFHDRLLLRTVGGSGREFRRRARYPPRVGWPRGAARLDARFARELHAGSAFHVESAALGFGAEADGDELRLGHRFVDSANGEVVTWISERWDLSDAPLIRAKHDAIATRLSAWNGPVVEQRPEPAGTAGFIPTGRGRVRPAIWTRPAVSLWARSCIGFPTRPRRPVPRSASTPNSWNKTGAGFRPLNWRCECPAFCASTSPAGRDRDRSFRQFVLAHDPPHDECARRHGNRPARAIWRQSRSRRAPPGPLAGRHSRTGGRAGRSGWLTVSARRGGAEPLRLYRTSRGLTPVPGVRRSNQTVIPALMNPGEGDRCRVRCFAGARNVSTWQVRPSVDRP